MQTVDDHVQTLAGVGPLGATARGSGRGYGDAAQRASGTCHTRTGLDAFGAVDVEGRTARARARAQAGARVGTFLRSGPVSGSVLPVLLVTAAVPVGGALASDVHGRNHLRDGSFAQHAHRSEPVTADDRSQSLAEAGVKPSVGSVGDSNDHALAASTNHAYPTELVRCRPRWHGIAEVQLPASAWVALGRHRAAARLGGLPHPHLRLTPPYLDRPPA